MHKLHKMQEEIAMSIPFSQIPQQTEAQGTLAALEITVAAQEIPLETLEEIQLETKTQTLIPPVTICSVIIHPPKGRTISSLTTVVIIPHQTTPQIHNKITPQVTTTQVVTITQAPEIQVQATRLPTITPPQLTIQITIPPPTTIIAKAAKIYSTATITTQTVIIQITQPPRIILVATLATIWETITPPRTILQGTCSVIT